jgi:hypothetical protein
MRHKKILIALIVVLSCAAYSVKGQSLEKKLRTELDQRKQRRQMLLQKAQEQQQQQKAEKQVVNPGSQSTTPTQKKINQTSTNPNNTDPLTTKQGSIAKKEE